MIRSSKHLYSGVNPCKLKVIQEFLFEYKLATQSYIDYIWSNTLFDQEDNVCFDIANDKLNLPLFLDYKKIGIITKLSARAQSSALCQALGIIRGLVKIRRVQLWHISRRKSEGLATEYYENRLKKISKPILKDNFQAELSSKNIDFKEVDDYFDLFIRLRSSGFDIANIPISYHKHSNKWKNMQGAKLLAGVLFSEKYIQLRWYIPDMSIKKTGESVGGDTGYKTIVTLSDNQITPKQDLCGHSLESINNKLSRQIRSSKNFSQTQDHRKNFINWSINQIDLSKIYKINLEKIDNLFYKNRTSRLMSHFTNSIIENKIKSYGEESGVQIVLKPSMYKSQRCSGCGVVKKSNRKGKLYHCHLCDTKMDADLNSALNNAIDLPNVPFGFNQLKLNIKGFFWKENGFYDLVGEELEFLAPNK